jgi:hypothetical protein
MELAILLNTAKTISANLAYVDIKEWGLIDETMTISGLKRSMEINTKTWDVISVRDVKGIEFCYPLGLRQTDLPFPAITASKVISEMPRFLRDGIKGVRFLQQYRNPQDSYWEVEYKKPGFISGATDGGNITFWEGYKTLSETLFTKTIYHEATHIIDAGDAISSTNEWRTAANADIKLTRQGRGKVVDYISEYAKVHSREDLCESMSLFMTERKLMKEIAPNREKFLSDLSKKLSKRFRKL